MGLLARLLGRSSAAPDLLTDLTEEYRAHLELAGQLRHHARRARYPQIAALLDELASIDERHAGWLREHIAARGGRIPEVAVPELPGRNQWERASAAARAARQMRRSLLDRIARWDPDEPETVALLERIEREDTARLDVLDRIVMRSDPQALD